MPAADKPLTELLDSKTTFLRQHQRQEWEREIRHTDQLLAANASTEKKFLANATRIRQQNEARKKLLAAQTPRELRPEERDTVAKLNRELLADVREGMVTQVEQRRGGPGIVDRIRRWHAAKKAKALLWKKTQILLHPDSTDRDLCNLERFRPTGAMSALTTDADIPGQFTLSPLAKAHYDEIDWSSPEVAAEVERQIAAGKLRIRHVRAADIARRVEGDVEVKESPDAVAVTVHRNGKKRELSETRRAALARGRARLAEKRAAARASESG